MNGPMPEDEEKRNDLSPRFYRRSRQRTRCCLTRLLVTQRPCEGEQKSLGAGVHSEVALARQHDAINDPGPLLPDERDGETHILLRQLAPTECLGRWRERRNSELQPRPRIAPPLANT